MSSTVADDVVRSWARIGGWAGIAAVAAYLLAAFAPLPDRAGYALAFAFGPLVAVASVGMGRVLAAERPGALPDLGAVFGIGAGFMVLAMLTTQQAIFARTPLGDGAVDEGTKALRRGLDAVHFGLDVAWDVLIGVSLLLFAIAMLRHSRFGRVMGATGIALALLLLGFNLWTFPVPPAAAGTIDWGPFVALWMLVANALLLRAARARG